MTRCLECQEIQEKFVTTSGWDYGLCISCDLILRLKNPANKFDDAYWLRMFTAHSISSTQTSKDGVAYAQELLAEIKRVEKEQADATSKE